MTLPNHSLGEEADREIEERRPHYLQHVRTLKERYCRGLPVRPVRVGDQSVTLAEPDIQAVIEGRFITQACESVQRYLDRARVVRPGAQPTLLLVGGSARLKGLAETLEARCGCPRVWWERSEYATVLGAVPLPPPKPRPDVEYRAAVEATWVDKKLDARAVERLSALASQIGVTRQQVADIERAVMGKTKEAILARQTAPAKKDKLVDRGQPQPTKKDKRMAPPRPQRTIVPSRVVHTLDHELPVESIAFSPDSRLLASGEFHGAIKLWEVNGGREVRTLTPEDYGYKWTTIALPVYTVAFSPNGRWLASGHDDGTVVLWQ